MGQQSCALLRSNWENVSVVPERFVDDGDTVVMLGREIESGTYSDTGESVSFPIVHVCDLESGKITKWKSFGDTALFNTAIED